MEIGHWRRTKLGGFTHPIALVVTNEKRLQVIEPIRVEGRGTHRRYLYPDTIDILIHLEQSNSGYRSTSIKCKTGQDICRRIREIVEQLWIDGDADVYGIVRTLSLLTLP